MKIAFTSCMSPNSYQSQPVWTTIAQQNPDVLVLLGDSVYIDCPPHPDGHDHNHPKEHGYVDNAFAQHLHALYRNQLAVPEFKALLNNGNLKTYAIWDDHDFLWNDANSKDARNKQHMNQALLSANLLRCWRNSLNRASFPISHTDDQIWANFTPVPDLSQYDALMPGYTHLALTEQIHLHLTDGRSWRTSGTLLGQTQRDQISEVVLKQAPDDAIHLLASGSTFERQGREGWKDHRTDHDWLLQLASQRRILMLSGDIHRNFTPAPTQTAGKKFYEVTASGAAVNFNPFHWNDKDPGKQSWLNYSQKFGLLDIQPVQVQITLFDHGKTTHPEYNPITISTW